MTENPDWTGFFIRSDPDSNNADDSPFLDDPVDGTVWLLELVIAVEFLRRGDRTNLTVWDALEEAIRWWTTERNSALDGVVDPDVADLTPDEPGALGDALSRLTCALRTQPDANAELALQQAVRRWCTSMSAIHNEGAPFLRVR